jgi:hypothetical protein
VGVNKLPFGVNGETGGRQAIGCPKDLDLMSRRQGLTLQKGATGEVDNEV